MPGDSRDVRLAVVGAGSMGSSHARVAAGAVGIELVAVHDVDRERAQKLASQFGALAVDSVAELCGLVDAAVVATPTPVHAPVAHELMGGGVDVLVEKPLAADVETAQRLVDAADAAHRVLMVGHVERFNPAILELDSLLEDVVHVEARRISVYSPRIRDDVVTDLMIHDLDLVAMIAGGSPVDVVAVMQAPRSASADLASALVRFDTGVTATLTASRVGQHKIRHIDITQKTNYLVIDLLRQDVTVHRVDEAEYRSDGGRRFRQVGVVEVPFLQQRGEPLALELAHFAECVRTRGSPRVTGADGVRSVDLVRRVTASVRG
jgi:predicted dehydrogenase